MQDKYFPLTMTTLENAWRSFTAAVEDFLRKLKAFIYHDLLKQLLNAYEQLGCNMM